MGVVFRKKKKMGKVHGSLARAGKVRSSAPKQAKKEKKGKKITGRARQRYKYNKRFSNLKKGARKPKPNSQIMQADKRKEAEELEKKMEEKQKLEAKKIK